MTTTTPSQGTCAKVTTVASFGTAMEFYDLFLAGSAAAVVWPSVFFSGAGPALSVALAVTAYAITFVARPIGGYIFGHLGDKYGRKDALVLTLVLMGLAMVGIALMPGYASIGILAPVMIIVLRIILGIGVGGELGGAISWVIEFVSKSKWRAFWTCWILLATAVGSIISSSLFSISITAIGMQAFVLWGWRVLFGLGAVLLVIGVIARYRMAESPLFAEIKERKEVQKMPANLAFKENWKKILLLSGITCISLLNPMIGVGYAITYQVQGLHQNAVMVSNGVAIGTLIALLFNPIASYVADKRGRKVVLYISAVADIIMLGPFFLLLSYGTPLMLTLAWLIFMAPQLFSNGAFGAFAAESFPTKYRYTASGMPFQFGSVIIGVLGALVLPAIIVYGGGIANSGTYVALVGLSLPVLALICLYFTKETKQADLAKIQV